MWHMETNVWKVFQVPKLDTSCQNQRWAKMINTLTQNFWKLWYFRTLEIFGLGPCLVLLEHSIMLWKMRTWKMFSFLQASWYQRCIIIKISWYVMKKVHTHNLVYTALWGRLTRTCYMGTGLSGGCTVLKKIGQHLTKGTVVTSNCKNL